MKVLLSIHPEHAEKILNGTKLYEYRKAYFKNNTYFNQKIRRVLLYATKPTGLIIGEFSIYCTLEGHPDVIWNITNRVSGVSKEEYFTYFGTNERAYAIRLKNYIRYDKPLTLEDIGLSRPPQSFMYLT